MMWRVTMTITVYEELGTEEDKISWKVLSIAGV